MLSNSLKSLCFHSVVEWLWVFPVRAEKRHSLREGTLCSALSVQVLASAPVAPSWQFWVAFHSTSRSCLSLWDGRSDKVMFTITKTPCTFLKQYWTTKKKTDVQLQSVKAVSSHTRKHEHSLVQQSSPQSSPWTQSLQITPEWVCFFANKKCKWEIFLNLTPHSKRLKD